MFSVKAFCETLEETNYHLQRELLEKQKEVESLKKLLGEKQLHIDALENRMRWVRTLLPGVWAQCPFDLTATLRVLGSWPAPL